MIRKVVLGNGIRVVAERMPSVKSASIGLWVNIGSRDEAAQEHGISHFLEHMFFKGTRRRSAEQIAKEIDAIGGELNAFTSRETTTFYAKALEDHLPKAVELLSDNFHYSKFDPRDIDKERQVVMEEIKMVEDDPEDLVHTLHVEDMLKGNPLGRSILGTPETLAKINRRRILDFLKRTYAPQQIVIAVAGRFQFDPLFSLLESRFGKYRGNGTPPTERVPPKITPQFQIKKRKFEQAHICISTPGLSVSHPQREALHVLSTILGGGISSRLFQEVRERRGLAYSIYSCPSFYQDGGIFTVYAGTSAKNLSSVTELIFKELKKLKAKGVLGEELKKAKEHIKGSLLLSTESTSSRMGRLAKDELYFGRPFSLKETIQGIQQVTLRHVHAVANTLFDAKQVSVTALGPIEPQMLPSPIDL